MVFTFRMKFVKREEALIEHFFYITATLPMASVIRGKLTILYHFSARYALAIIFRDRLC